MTDEERILAEEYGIKVSEMPTCTIHVSKLPEIKIYPPEAEPKRKVSPYAKFDKYHHKKKRK